MRVTHLLSNMFGSKLNSNNTNMAEAMTNNLLEESKKLPDFHVIIRWNFQGKIPLENINA